MVAANQALVPAFRTSLTRRGERATDHLISMVLCTVVAGRCRTGAPLMAPGRTARARHGAWHHEQPGHLAASMLPVVFAMVPLVAVAEVMRAYLNARYAFVAPALMTVVLNGLGSCSDRGRTAAWMARHSPGCHGLSQRRSGADGLHEPDGAPSRAQIPASSRRRATSTCGASASCASARSDLPASILSRVSASS